MTRDRGRDVVVTVPARIWPDWLAEGGLPGDPDDGIEYFFWIGNRKPNIDPGQRVYVVALGKLRGYAPLVRIHFDAGSGRYALVRAGGAVAVTLGCRAYCGCAHGGPKHPARIRGFRGFRYRWWPLADEMPFEKWREP